MKILKKLLLINWHYFTHELIEFEQLNYMTGVNASGKSTIIDALQLVLLGETGGNYFNKSASGKSSRTLISYLCGEIRDDDKDGFKYLRNDRFVSYIVVEFYDDEKDRFFSFGICFDVYSVNDLAKRFFRYRGRIPENHFIENKVPFDIQKLRVFFKENNYKDVIFYESGKHYREDIYALLGGLRSKFGDLLKKAVAFNPDNDIQKFITEFVCDNEKNVDISLMQENIRNYKNLERTAAELERKKTALEQISTNYYELQKNRDNEKIYKYLVDKSEIDIIEKKLAMLKKQVRDLETKSEHIRQSIKDEAEIYDRLQEEHRTLKNQYDYDEVNRRINEIDKEISQLKMSIDSAEKEFEKVVLRILSVKNIFTRANSTLVQKYNSVDLDLISSVLQSLIASLCDSGAKLSVLFDELNDITPEQILKYSKGRFEEIIELIEGIKSDANILFSKLDDEFKKTGEKFRELKAEEKNLEKGIYKFPQNALDLKHAIISAIRAKSGESADVVIVAEVSEIKNSRWRNAIEGYLNNQKFYIIVPPQHIKTAIRVFNRIKKDKAIYDTGIVDVEKIRNKNYRTDKNSLAEEIETTNPYVRIYLDYILGRVIKCYNADDIRSFHTSITDDGLLYKNFAVKALSPKLWKNPAIGQNAIKIRIEEIKKEIYFTRELSNTYSTLKIGVEGCRTLENYSKSDIEYFARTADNLINSEDFKSRMSELADEKASLDTSSLFVLEEKIKEKKLQLAESGRKKDKLQEEGGKVEEQIRSINEEKIPQNSSLLQEKQTVLEREFYSDWIEDTGKLRYMQELSKRVTAENINEAFPRELSKAKNAIDKFDKLLTELRSQYNHDFRMGYDVNSCDNAEFDNALKEINENELPNYLTRINDTKKKAMEEFQEDFLSKLSDNIRSVKCEIVELNRAISSASFGEDTYSFRVEPNKEYERYYKMITDDMLLIGGYNLMSNQFNLKYKNEIEDLFSIITGEGNTSLEQSDYENRIRTFTDYRTYLNFDIEVTNQAGEVQRLSKTIGKKSGGETQTPFYIAVLASFAQLYRIGRDNKASTARIIIFDEAFSKMDGERIEKSIGLLRKLNFQVVLSTPTEKASDIAPLVDRVLLVLRKGTNSRITYFDKERIGEHNCE